MHEKNGIAELVAMPFPKIVVLVVVVALSF